jgi:hypothetical protein
VRLASSSPAKIALVSTSVRVRKLGAAQQLLSARAARDEPFDLPANDGDVTADFQFRHLLGNDKI